MYYKEYQFLWATDGPVNIGFLNCTAETDGTYTQFSISTLLIRSYSTPHKTGQVNRSPVLNFLIGCFQFTCSSIVVYVKVYPFSYLAHRDPSP